VYNKARDPPCLAFFGNSHMGQHILTIASLAKEYDVSYLYLARNGKGDVFGGCDSRPLPASPWDEQRIRILKQWKPKSVVFSSSRPYCLLKHNRTFDALMSGAPEKVLIMGDNPHLSSKSLPFLIGIKKKLLEDIKTGDVSSLDFLSTVKPEWHVGGDSFLRTEDQIRKALDSNPKYNGTFQFESTYPAFMDQNNTFVQVIGAETEGGNRLIYFDRTHLTRDGSERLREYFREHIFRDLKC